MTLLGSFSPWCENHHAQPTETKSQLITRTLINSAEHPQTEHVAKECLVIVLLQLNVAPSVRTHPISDQFKSLSKSLHSHVLID